MMIMHFSSLNRIVKQLVIQLRTTICFTKITKCTMLFFVLPECFIYYLNQYFSIYSDVLQKNKIVFNTINKIYSSIRSSKHILSKKYKIALKKRTI